MVRRCAGRAHDPARISSIRPRQRPGGNQHRALRVVVRQGGRRFPSAAYLDLDRNGIDDGDLLSRPDSQPVAPLRICWTMRASTRRRPPSIAHSSIRARARSHAILRVEGEYAHGRGDNSKGAVRHRSIHAYAGKSYLRVLTRLSSTASPTNTAAGRRLPSTSPRKGEADRHGSHRQGMDDSRRQAEQSGSGTYAQARREPAGSQLSLDRAVVRPGIGRSGPFIAAGPHAGIAVPTRPQARPHSTSADLQSNDAPDGIQGGAEDRWLRTYGRPHRRMARCIRFASWSRVRPQEFRRGVSNPVRSGNRSIQRVLLVARGWPDELRAASTTSRRGEPQRTGRRASRRRARCSSTSTARTRTTSLRRWWSGTAMAHRPGLAARAACGDFSAHESFPDIERAVDYARLMLFNQEVAAVVRAFRTAT